MQRPSRWWRPALPGCLLLLCSFTAMSAENPGWRAAADAPPAPRCALAGPKNLPQQLEGYRGRVVYVDFWASWCGPCRQSFPFMDVMQKAMEKRGLSIVAIDLDEDAAEAARFLAGQKVSFRVVGGDNSACARAFAVDSMPMTYLLDREGRVRFIQRGFRKGGGEALREHVERLLDEKPVAGKVSVER